LSYASLPVSLTGTGQHKFRDMTHDPAAVRH